MFFIPILVDSVISTVDSKTMYASCFTNATTEFVSEAYINMTDELTIKAEKTLNGDDYGQTLRASNKIKDKSIKNIYSIRLNNVTNLYYRSFKDTSGIILMMEDTIEAKYISYLESDKKVVVIKNNSKYINVIVITLGITGIAYLSFKSYEKYKKINEI